MRFAGDVFGDANPYLTGEGDESLGDSFEAAGVLGKGEETAMTRGRALQILNSVTKEAVRRNITPDAFQDAMFQAGLTGTSTDYTRRNIRNAMKTPILREVVENPGLARDLMEAGVGKLGALGVNPESASKYTGLALDVLGEAKKDGILRPDVTHGEIEKKVQEPMYGALQDWARTTGRTQAVRELVGRTRVGSGNPSLSYEQKLRALAGLR